MKVGDEVDFILFGNPSRGVIYEINKDEFEETVSIESGGRYNGDYGVGAIKPYRYPNCRILKELPKREKDIPPWYILKN